MVGEANDEARAIELFRRAAELSHHRAQRRYSEMGFGERDWERYFWWAKAAEGGVGVAELCRDVAKLLPSFE
jgi:TPR repeat protein